MTEVVKYLIQESTTDAVDNSSRNAELTQLAQRDMSDSQSLYTTKVPSNSLMVGSPHTPLLGVSVEILPLLEWGCSSRLLLKAEGKRFSYGSGHQFLLNNWVFNCNKITSKRVHYATSYSNLCCVENNSGHDLLV